MNLPEPYWVAPADELPCRDFNRELVHPGANETFPEGAVGVRVDDDFWAVAALPWEWRDVSIESIVAKLWPGIEPEGFHEDSEQTE